ncbi:hypothetical protein CLOSTMETH_01885 [[Clostridium] methylpentosum DSM 5476]|uniref:Uncharacterized protein n=1 Tax=[Clostridium] methylpentosum DSM 5476 TaxID=537013 RepID=C0EDF8_9FIRM|nr:hypothetical protein CLOSTMETH_01885 [[Clostridium] methylpentosum DSM 5476]
MQQVEFIHPYKVAGCCCTHATLKKLRVPVVFDSFVVGCEQN